MNTGNWTKLYGNTIYSTVWQEPPAIRCVWITMLAIADFEGYVGASVPGLAKASNVTMEETLAALERFSGPDEYSRTKEHDGRRIEEVAGGWKILNFVAHRDGSDDQREKWARQKRIQRMNAKARQVKRGKPLVGETAAVEAMKRGDFDGAAAIAASGLPEATKAPESFPEVPNRNEVDGFIESEAATRQAEVEVGQWVDGKWVPD